jgi:preprotein translocase subunit SecG
LLSGGGNMQARGQATGLTKLTWIFAVAFICTSITLAVMSARDAGGGSVVDTGAPAEAHRQRPPTKARRRPEATCCPRRPTMPA